MCNIHGHNITFNVLPDYLVFLAELKELWIQRDDRYVPLLALVKSLCDNSEKDPHEFTATLLSTYMF